jgi:hypothetical protein
MMANAFMNLVKVLFGSVLSIIWLPLGGLFWFPLVIRALAGFSLSVTRAAVVGGPVDGKTLEHAIRVWGEGFRHIWRGLFRSEGDPAPVDQAKLGRLAFECLWAALVWYSTVWIASRWIPGLSGFHEWWSSPLRPFYEMFRDQSL